MNADRFDEKAVVAMFQSHLPPLALKTVRSTLMLLACAQVVKSETVRLLNLVKLPPLVHRFHNSVTDI